MGHVPARRYRLAEGDRLGAKRHFQKFIDTGVFHTSDYYKALAYFSGIEDDIWPDSLPLNSRVQIDRRERLIEMKLGLITDIHEAVEPLRAALRRFRDERVDQVVALGDIFFLTWGSRLWRRAGY